MKGKLLAAGVVLTLLAVGSESRWLTAHTGTAAANQASLAHRSLTDRVVHGVTDAFDSVVADAVKTGIQNAEQTLQYYQPTLHKTYGDDRRKATELAEEIKKACAQARVELTDGRTFVALDYVMQASRDLDEMKKVFERR